MMIHFILSKAYSYGKRYVYSWWRKPEVYIKMHRFTQYDLNEKIGDENRRTISILNWLDPDKNILSVDLKSPDRKSTSLFHCLFMKWNDESLFVSMQWKTRWRDDKFVWRTFICVTFTWALSVFVTKLYVHTLLMQSDKVKRKSILLRHLWITFFVIKIPWSAFGGGWEDANTEIMIDSLEKFI